VLSDVDYLTSNVNFGNTYTQVPYDSVEQVASDLQKLPTGFRHCSYFRTLIRTSTESPICLSAHMLGREDYSILQGRSIPPIFSLQGTLSTNTCLRKTGVFTTLGIAFDV